MRTTFAGRARTLALLVSVALVSGGTSAEEISLAPAQLQQRERGTLRDDGAFSFWDNGLLGDRFIAAGTSIQLTVVAAGRTVAGEPPRLAVEIARADGRLREAAQIVVLSAAPQPYTVVAPVTPGYCVLRLRHLNRSVAGKPKEFRHLTVSTLRVVGARQTDDTPTKWLLFRGPSPAGPAKERAVAIDTPHFQVAIDRESGAWSLAARHGELRLEAIRPALVINSDPLELGSGEVRVQTPAHPLLGPCHAVTIHFQQPGRLAIDYHIAVSKEQPEAIVQLDFENRSAQTLEVNRSAPLVVGRLVVAGATGQWNALGDGKSNDQPCQLLPLADARQFESWWYLGLKRTTSGRALLLGSVSNNKGLGRFYLDTADETGRVAAWHDYEALSMPPGARIVGEPVLLHFGQSGVDSLDRFGAVIARAHGIDLGRQHPIDPQDPRRAGLFNTWNSYGAGVIRGFPYRHDAPKYDKPYMDPAWSKANWKKIHELGLDAFGYGWPARNMAKSAPAPLARRYGQADFWGKDLEQIAREHPDFYIDGRIDFSHPGVVELERGRVAGAFRDPSRLVTYGWDFTNYWSRLPGQHDPFQTSAETYRTAMGLWREHALRHAAGAYGLVWMNVVGLNYDRCDVIHIGHDSDQAYYGRGCTVAEGLVRQISGRAFYNGQVWWNSADSFHVYAGGIYSLQQAKTHASFCALAGNLMHLAEPFCDQETPADRLEIIRRVAPTTADVSRAVDVFEHAPARLWNMRVQRSFGAWNIVGLFNFDCDQQATPITQEIRMADLGLPSDRDYLVYEFWSHSFLGPLRGSFTRTLRAPDCEIFAMIESANHPQLLSTNRHVRQMAVDVLDLKWNPTASTLSGVSRLVRDDRYELRIHVPAGVTPLSAVAGDLQPVMRRAGPLVLVEFTAATNCEVPWAVRFRPAGAAAR